MPHPRINPALAGEYVRVGDYPGELLSGEIDRPGWIKLSEIQNVRRDGDKLRFKFKKPGRPDHVSDSPHKSLIETNLRKKGVDV